jgi:hypothetical protein
MRRWLDFCWEGGGGSKNAFTYWFKQLAICWSPCVSNLNQVGGSAKNDHTSNRTLRNGLVYFPGLPLATTKLDLYGKGKGTMEFHAGRKIHNLNDTKNGGRLADWKTARMFWDWIDRMDWEVRIMTLTEYPLVSCP